MNIAFMVLDAHLGGHTRTAVAIAQALIKRGHNVVFVIGRTSPSRVIEAQGITFVRAHYAAFSSVENSLGRLRDELGIDVVHSFSTLGLAEAVSFCKTNSIPLVWTRCAGPPPSEPLEKSIIRMLRLKTTTTLSCETRDALVNLTGLEPGMIKIISARIDLASISAQAAMGQTRAAEFRKKYNLPDNAAVLLRIARVGPTYESSIVDSLNAAATLYRKGYNVRFVHIGHVDVPASQTRIVHRMAELNAEFRVQFALTAQDEAVNASDYVPLAAVVFGVGRSAFESMAHSKPTLVVGAQGFAGVAQASTISALAYNNFSGRGPTYPIQALVEALSRLLSDPQYYREVADFSRRYVETELSAEAASQSYEEIYMHSAAIDLPNWRTIQQAVRISKVRRVLRASIPTALRNRITGAFALRVNKGRIA